MGRWKRVYTLLLTGALLATCYQPSVASNEKIRDLENKKKTSSESLLENKDKINQIEEEKNRILNEIAGLDVEISKLEEQIQAINLEIQTLEEDIKRAEAEIKELEANIGQRGEDFKKRLKAMYINSQAGNLELIFAAQDLSDLLSRASMMKFVTEYDLEILNDLKHSKLEVDAKKSELSGKKSAAEIAKEKLEDSYIRLQEKIQEKYAMTEKLQADLITTQEDISILEADIERIDQAIKDEKIALEKERQRKLEEEKRRAQAKLLAAQQAKQRTEYRASLPSNLPTGQGVLGWPVPNSRRITSVYGLRSNPTGAGYDFHQGLDIGAPSGEIIVAAEAGTVIYTGYMGSYGNLVKVQHDNGLVTYYGHCSGFISGVGQRVQRGTPIALIGSTGNSTGPHLHFEVRINGRHTDPMYYLNR